MTTFRKDLEAVINRHSQENGSNTPDFVLATFLSNCLVAFDVAVNERTLWYYEENGKALVGQRTPFQVGMDWPRPDGEKP